MSNLITPWSRNIFTDVFGTLMNFQQHERCAIHELRLVDCLEAHGVHHSQKACKALLEDFRECVFRCKQDLRVEIMRNERERQVADGERAPEDQFAPAPATVD